MRHVQHAADYGVIIKGEIGFDWDKIIKRSRGVADKLSGGVEHLFKKYGVAQILGTATLTGRGKIEVATTAAGKATGKLTLETPRTIIATGARAKFLPGIEPDGDRVITYREAMVLPEVPKSVVVIGAGAIGIEFADFWNAFGVEVTVIEYMPRVLPIEDEEISASLTRVLKKRKMTIHTAPRPPASRSAARRHDVVHRLRRQEPDGDVGARADGGRRARQHREHRPRRHGRHGRPRLHPGRRRYKDDQPRHLGDRRLRRAAAAGARRDG
jgi:pyruvate/2-oxoglutarate dehydrogenase complex dihydrolipoamide dehydrogenase (E3) component